MFKNYDTRLQYIQIMFKKYPCTKIENLINKHKTKLVL